MSDILVIGAGPVGATFALLAKSYGLDVSLIDARNGASTETRSLALSHGSRLLLERAHAWTAELEPSEIHTVHTSQQGGFGRVKLSRDDVSVPALGYVVGYSALQAVLDQALERAGILGRLGARVSKIVGDSAQCEVQFQQDGIAQSISAKMIVMADGGANLDKLPNIAIEEKDYGQSALLASVTTDRAHQHIAYERFTPNGPLALLPYRSEKDFALVWVASHAQIDALMHESDDDLRKAFQLQFGQRAGTILTLTNRRRYPLKLRQTNARVSGCVAIIGNAAQAMHPVAGQGFNLGLRDAQTLANLVAQRGIDDALNQYDRLRQVDVASGVGITDLLAGAFLSDVSTLRVPRGVALALVDLLPVVRRRLANRMLFGVGRT